MANLTWKNMGFKLDSSTGTITDISSYVNSESIASAITDLMTTGMGATSNSRVNGLANISLNINGFVNSTTRGIFAPIAASGTSVTKTFQFTVGTNMYLTGECLPTSVQFSGSPDTLELFSATLVVTGACASTSVAAS